MTEPLDHQMSSGVQRAVDLLHAITRTCAGTEMETVATNLFELDNGETSTGNCSLTDILGGLLESIDAVMNWAKEKEGKRKYSFMVNTTSRLLETSETDLCEVSDLDEEDVESTPSNATNQTKKQVRKQPCNICGKKYSKSAMWFHKRTHIDDVNKAKPHACDVCGMRYMVPSGLEIHKMTHLADDDPRRKTFDCDICGKVYRKRYALISHKRSHLADEESRLPYKCEECGRRFARNSDLNSHKFTHLAPDDPLKWKPERVSCDICERSFGSGQSLLEHKRSHLEEDDEARLPYECDECGRRFMRSSTLKIHKRTHLSDSDKKTEECEKCGKFFTICGIWHHRRTHLDETDPEQAKLRRPFKCEECGKSFTIAQTLKDHMTAFHSKEPVERPFECNICGKRSMKAGDLKKHIKTHFPEKYECEICGKIFNSKRTFKKHEPTHLDENDPEQAKIIRPFECAECGMAFRDARALNGHMNFHTGNFPHKCDICPAGFNTSTNLRKHKEGHEKGTSLQTGRTKLCTLCPRRFNKIHELAKHLKRHQEGIVGDSTDDEDDRNLESHDCQECGKKCASHVLLNKHIRKMHEGGAKRPLQSCSGGVPTISKAIYH